MSRYEGKRTARTQLPEQLRTDPELAEDIRFIARRNMLPIGLQILHWILRAVEEEKAKSSQQTSGGVRGAEPMAVRRRQISSGERMA